MRFSVNKMLIVCILLILAGNYPTYSYQATWNLILEQEGLKFSYQETQCDGFRVLYFKVENTNTSTVNNTYTITINTGTESIDFPQFITDLQPGTSVLGSCEAPNPMYTIPIDPDLTIEEISITYNP